MRAYNTTSLIVGYAVPAFFFIPMQKDDNNPWKLVSFALELGFLITIPLLALALLGRFIDVALKSSPIFFLLAVILSIVISSIIVVKKVSDLIGDAENQNRSVDPSTAARDDKGEILVDDKEEMDSRVKPENDIQKLKTDN